MHVPKVEKVAESAEEVQLKDLLTDISIKIPTNISKAEKLQFLNKLENKFKGASEKVH